MPRQNEHDMLVRATHDELARQEYISTLRMHLLNDTGQGMRTVYEKRARPAFEREHGRPPADEHEVRKLMLGDNYFRSWSTLMRATQEMIWESVQPSVERDLPALIEKAKPKRGDLGTLTLDPDLEIPAYQRAVDIHLMPGSYHTEFTADDVAAGALYDRGAYVYTAGFSGPLNDNIGESVARFVRRKFPDFRPRKILDLGCTIGANTVPFVDHFPEAEVHAVDVAAPVLRYGHARAETMGKRIHFHQMNAESLGFPDEAFDLVYSIIFFHETSRKALKRILREAYRVLKPGGLMLHMELPPNTDMDPYDAFYIDWDAYYNNEPFYASYSDYDVRELVAEAGFDPEDYLQFLIPDAYFSSEQELEEALAAGDIQKSETGRWGESVRWFTYGARK